MKMNRWLPIILMVWALISAACAEQEDADARDDHSDSGIEQSADTVEDSDAQKDGEGPLEDGSGRPDDAGANGEADAQSPDAADTEIPLPDAGPPPEEEPEDERYYPGEDWEEVTDFAAAGWSEEQLDEAKQIAQGLNMNSVVLVHQGRIVVKWGDYTRKVNLHSMRKSLLSALYGPSVDSGLIDIEATMLDMNIDDIPPSLSATEKSATIEMLLKARSGIYHDSAYTTASMREKQPERHSHEPGTFWYYNNWDFNVLGVIYNQQTGQDLYEAFKEIIGDPIGMTDFVPATDGKYVYAEELSAHPAYTFYMTSLDLARFGLLMARKGKWKEQRIFSESWFEESTFAYSSAGSKRGYGYMWWVSPAPDKHYRGDSAFPLGLFKAKGARGQVIAVVPDQDLVFVYQNADHHSGEKTTYGDINRVLKALLAAKIDGFEP